MQLLEIREQTEYLELYLLKACIEENSIMMEKKKSVANGTLNRINQGSLLQERLYYDTFYEKKKKG